MILLYTLALLLLGAAHWIVQRRAAALGRAFARRAEGVLRLVNAPAFKLGNSGKYDLSAAAKQQYELARLAIQRDRAEAKYYKAQTLADRLSRWAAVAKAWKGKKLPYTMGACDVWLVLYLIDRIGVGALISLRQLMDVFTALLKS